MHGLRTRALAVASLVFVIAAAACGVGSLDLANRECPCVDGWVCDAARNRCVVRLPTTAEGADAAVTEAASPAPSDGADAAVADASDAGALDATLPDPGPDAARPDAAKSPFACPPAYGVLRDGGTLPAPPDGGSNCFVYADGYLRCGNLSTYLSTSPHWGAPQADELWSLFTAFDCFEYGDPREDGNRTWYRTCGNLKKAPGFAQAKFLFTRSTFDANPAAFGLPRCSQPSDAGADGSEG